MRRSLLLSLSGTLILLALMVVPAPVHGNEGMPPERALYAAELERLTCEFQDQLKCNFRKAECYGRMKIKGFQVKVHSAAIERRSCRDACYDHRFRDGQRVQELVCKLQEMWSCSSQAADVACLECERARINGLLASMGQLADCLAGTPSPMAMPLQMNAPQIEGYYPPVGASRPGIAVPSYPDRLESQFRVAPGDSSQTVAPPAPLPAVPALESAKPAEMRSVLDQ